MTRTLLTALNLSLFVLFPLAWVAPLMRAGLLPLFGLSEISVLSGILSLWEEDVLLAVAVALFAIVAPILKTAGLALIHFRLTDSRLLSPLTALGKLAMADVFLIAIYITLAKGVGVGRVEPAWGLWLFTACVLASFAVSLATSALVKRGALG
jgi:uncharacterized paraquat-inducible protein A